MRNSSTSGARHHDVKDEGDALIGRWKEDSQDEGHASIDIDELVARNSGNMHLAISSGALGSLEASRDTLLQSGVSWHASILVALVCGGWTVVSSSAILVNKHLMSNLSFPYPCTIAWMGLLTTTLASYLWCRIMLPGRKRYQMTSKQYVRAVLPTGFFMAVTFQTGNMGYLYLTVAFVQMLKAFCPVVTMLLLFFARLEKATTRLVAAVMMIAVGVAMASYGETHLNMFGLVAMIISVFAESTRLVLTQHLLVGGGTMHPLEGLMYIGSACTGWLMVLAAMSEWPHLMETGAYRLLTKHPLEFAAAAVAGFGVNTLAILVIKVSSSLTLKVLGTIKDVGLVTVGIVFLREQVTELQLFGYLVSMSGFVYYNYIKAIQPKQHTLLIGKVN